ncbi:unnamed protein product, partial [Larinioides sclopetarius]
MGTYCIKKANRWRKRSCFLSSVSCSCVPVLKSSWLHDALKVAFQIWTFVITGFFVESVFVAMGTYCIKKANRWRKRSCFLSSVSCSCVPVLKS